MYIWTWVQFPFNSYTILYINHNPGENKTWLHFRDASSFLFRPGWAGVISWNPEVAWIPSLTVVVSRINHLKTYGESEVTQSCLTLCNPVDCKNLCFWVLNKQKAWRVWKNTALMKFCRWSQKKNSLKSLLATCQFQKEKVHSTCVFLFKAAEKMLSISTA